jgi:hypothetical protein
VSEAASIAPATSIFCAAQCRYLPHGGSDDLWLALTPTEGSARRLRSFYVRNRSDLQVTCTFTAAEAAAIGTTLTNSWHMDAPSVQALHS